MNSAPDTSTRLSPSVLRAAMDLLADRSESLWSATPPSLEQISRSIYVRYHKGRPTADAVAVAPSENIVDALVNDLPPEVDLSVAEVVTHPTDSAGDPSRVTLVRGVRVLVPDSRLTRLPDGRPAASLPSLRVGLSPGYVSYLHRTPVTDKPPGSVLRLYVGIRDGAAAPPIWRKVLRHLCLQEVSFTAKCLHVPHAFPASDALVVYTDQASLGALGDLARNLESTAGISSAGASVFTRQITHGCSVAVETPGGQARSISFGQHRAAAMARGVLRAYERGRADHEAVAREITEAFEQDGIDPARPYLPLSRTEFSSQVQSWLEGTP